MRNFLIIVVLLVSFNGLSQRWHFQYGFKVGAGKNFLQGDSKIDNAYNFNYQLGFTSRITKKVLIMDLGVLFRYSPYFNSPNYGQTRTNTTGLNIPFTIGVVMINRPMFKWNLQAGMQNSFTFSDGFTKKWPLDPLVYNPYQLSGILKTGIEVAWFILDVYYQPGITRMFKGSGWNHSVNISVGLIF